MVDNNEQRTLPTLFHPFAQPFSRQLHSCDVSVKVHVESYLISQVEADKNSEKQLRVKNL